ncbi:hypothetical protein BAL199_21089 [alpha proteobacterium BAL199]|nr:hypothetical protein BAL199_21089 [alpha proteobacterium BAL199]
MIGSSDLAEELELIGADGRPENPR